jgi:hypothetical protein
MFKTLNTTRVAYAKLVKPLLVEFQLTNKVIMHVKIEGSNLNTLAITLFLVVSCALLQVEQPFVGFALDMQCQKLANIL